MLNNALFEFMEQAETGRQRFSLGAGLFKLRLPSKSGRGKSGGCRSILAIKSHDRMFWLHLYSKNDVGNISIKTLKKLKILAKILFDLDDTNINRLLLRNQLLEVMSDDKA